MIEYAPPPDKSISIRAVLLAAFAKGRSRIRHCLKCEDTAAAISCIKALGASVAEYEDYIEIEGGNIHSPDQPLFCGSSGSVARFLCGLLSGSGIEAVLCGSSQLSRRPMARITAPLRLMGADITGDALPLRIAPALLHGIEYKMPISSAQVKTALLFAGMNASGSTIVKEKYLSRDHGENILEQFSVPVEKEYPCGGQGSDGTYYSVRITSHALKPCEITVPGDFSSAAFFIAGAQLSGMDIRINSVGLNKTRTGMLEVLKRAGAEISAEICSGEDSETSCEPHGALTFRPAALRPIYVRESEIPKLIDEIPALSVIAASIPGESVFCGIGELRYKETDRIVAIMDIAAKMGASAECRGDDLHITGIGKLPDGHRIIDCRGDHRVAMAAAAGSLACHGMALKGAACAAKSYPGFFNDFQKIFGKLILME
ncbi:MAG: 3-phosphoshikimate 1-carboxyvinyltransferase [Elusimicrobiales bacterium]|nr:3-phosphoshikimate 1-carboxyvinyltransferase [Elusimicrobiales bacterium]